MRIIDQEWSKLASKDNKIDKFRTGFTYFCCKRKKNFVGGVLFQQNMVEWERYLSRIVVKIISREIDEWESS